MPLIVSGFNITLAGRVRETTQIVGTGPYSLDGAPSGKRTFIQGVGGGSFTFYTVELGANWETGIGEITAGSPPTLSRSSILESSNGNNAVNWPAGVKDIFLDLAAAGLHSLQDQISNATYVNRIVSTAMAASGTFTRNSDCIFARVRIVAAGGAGGGAQVTNSTQHSEGGGGGGGEYAEGWFTAAAIGTSQTVTIGAGGTPNAAGNGGPGGTTSFGSLLTAIGGSGGTFGTAVGAPGGVSGQFDGGFGGSGGIGGSVRVRGSRGGQGAVRDTQWQGQANGGGTALGGASTMSQGNAVAGQLYGGGGTGAANSQSSSSDPGGAGAAGVCIVDEFCKV